MDELQAAAMAVYPLTLAPLLLLLLAPLCGRAMRAGFAVTLLLGAFGFAVLAIVQAGGTAPLEVVTAFRRGAVDPQPFLYVVERVTAPAWQWPLVCAAALLLPGALLWWRRERRPVPPCPVIYCSVLGIWVLAVRLGLEQTAAPEFLVWAVGVTPAALVLTPFIGGFAGARGMGLAAMLLAQVGVAAGHRGAVIAFSYFATSGGWGTHLDVNVLTDIHPPLFGHRVFGDDPVAKWWHGIAVIQVVLWVPIIAVTGSVLGLLPWWLARRRAG